MSDFLIKLAQGPKEVESAQRLRFEVFNLELKKGLKAAHESGLDRDEYDPICDHVLIIDKKSGATIGTYRLLLRSRLGADGRFYSENEFDLANIRKADGEILEMGRSCVHKDYRSNSILLLLWQRILSYVEDHRVRYIIGCPSLYTMDTAEISSVYSLMKKEYLAPREFRVYPKEKASVPGLSDSVPLDGQERKVLLKLPSLIRSYIKIGAQVCGEPALDPEFGTADFFMLLDVSRMADSYLRRFRVHNVPLR
ncbi:MAG TPA: hemolysin [Candidatus Omnitrophica bacterium]|nr:hemolysin [Candidatus Omnitrophota bacterium]